MPMNKKTHFGGLGWLIGSEEGDIEKKEIGRKKDLCVECLNGGLRKN